MKLYLNASIDLNYYKILRYECLLSLQILRNITPGDVDKTKNILEQCLLVLLLLQVLLLQIILSFLVLINSTTNAKLPRGLSNSNCS